MILCRLGHRLAHVGAVCAVCVAAAVGHVRERGPDRVGSTAWLLSAPSAVSSGAVQLELHDGRRLRVGTDEPEQLSEAIRMMKGAGG